jgi:autotransporter-associated beta strand protein
VDSSQTYGDGGALAGSGGLLKAGPGTLVLFGTDVFTGPTIVNQGELAINGSLASPVTVNSGGILGGTGSLTSVTVNSGGQLSPGNSPGVLLLSGSLTLASGAVLDWDLSSPGASDKVIDSVLNLNGQQFSDFSFNPLPGFVSGQYTLISGSQINGGLGSSLSGTIGGMPATLSLQGNNLLLDVTPEPAALSLFAAGALATAVYRWKRRRKALVAKRAAHGTDAREDSGEEAPAILRFPTSTCRSTAGARRAA